MLDAELAEAERHLQRLEELLSQSAPGRDSAAALSAISRAHTTLSALIPDIVFRDRLAELQTYVEVTFSNTAHVACSPASPTGAQWLRIQVTRALNALDARLRMLRQNRQAGV